MTIGEASAAAYKAGKASGDTGLFDSWLDSKGLQDRSSTLRRRLKQEYDRGFEANFAGTSTETHERRAAASGPIKYKGYTIREVEGGYSTSLDRESVHDTVKDAKDFIDSARNPRRRNPQEEADSAFESFHGEPPEGVVIVEEKIHEHEHLWACGRLIDMTVDTLSGLEVTFTFEHNSAPYLSCSEDGRQLYIEGGDQKIDLAAIKMDGPRWVKDRMVIGVFAEPRGARKHNITYRTRKDFDKFEEIDYQHELGEPSKELRKPAAPFLEYDPRSEKMYISGGQYVITKSFIGTSPGIEN
jgi:hypothetical protein